MYIIAALIVVTLGLVSRKMVNHLPEIVNMYLGDALWALMIYLYVAIIFKTLSIKRVAIFSLLFCYLIELSQLYHALWIDLVKSEIDTFMLSQRKIGNATFTIMSILLFFVSVYLSFILATLIRHAFEPQDDQNVKKRNSLGSYLLLFRLLILCAGFVVGILASGLALTNFAIFLGAMGVGIGFGLQNIVSNLVSGLIIAFERPFVVGDILDFENETCKVKEISLRATMVSNSEGADILIPNNNLLSENLKNWTISNKHRVVELRVLTTQAANPENVMAIIGNCIGDDKNIFKERSMVLLSDINETGLVFTVKVLVTDLANSSKIKSQLFSRIHGEFSRQGIRFSQRKYTEEPLT